MPERKPRQPCLRPARRHQCRRLPPAGTHSCWPRKTLRTPVVPGSRFLNAALPRSTYPAADLDYVCQEPRRDCLGQGEPVPTSSRRTRLAACSAPVSPDMDCAGCPSLRLRILLKASSAVSSASGTGVHLLVSVALMFHQRVQGLVVPADPAERVGQPRAPVDARDEPPVTEIRAVPEGGLRPSGVRRRQRRWRRTWKESRSASPMKLMEMTTRTMAIPAG